MTSSLTLLAGPQALRTLRERGLRAEDIDVVVGASGGPKWLAVAGLDRYLFGSFFSRARARPLHLVGSSIGAWRMACLAQADGLAALERTHEVYLEQRYPPKPTPAQVMVTVSGLLETLLGEGGAAEIVDSPWARLHVLASEFRGLLASGRPGIVAAGLALAGLGNLLERDSLRAQMRRVIVHNAGDASPFAGLCDFPTLHLPLNHATLRPALLATASLPLLMTGARIPGGSGRLCMDGGFIDYHPDFDFGDSQGLVLYPHYYPHIVPGWFDKALPWRRSRSGNLARALLIAPSREFAASLPRGKIPDRGDFQRLSERDRLGYWRAVMAASERLGEELHELLASGRLAERVRPL